jgi:WD40 repeat protein
VLDPIPGFGTSLSRNGHILAAATGPNETDNAVRLWDLRTGKLLGLCTGHKQSVWSIAFSPDGRTLATASDDSTLKLWNVATLQEVISIRRLGGALRGLLFSPDGQWLVGTSGGGPFAHGGGLWFYHAPLLAKEDLALHEIQNR